MLLIRFPDRDAKRRALGFLAGRFSFRSWATGEMNLPETALAALTAENIPFSVIGAGDYTRYRYGWLGNEDLETVAAKMQAFQEEKDLE